MFRKSATTLFNASKSLVSPSLKSVTPVTSSQHFSNYIRPDRGYFAQSVKEVFSGNHSKYLGSTNQKAATKQTTSLSEAIAERTLKLEALKAELNHLSSENEKDKAKLADICLFTESKAKEIVKSAGQFENALIDALTKAISNRKRSCEFDYTPGQHVSFLMTVLEQYQIKLNVVSYYHPIHGEINVPKYELLLPDDLRAHEIPASANQHAVYGPWLNQFREKLNQVVAPEAVQEYSPNMRPML